MVLAKFSQFLKVRIIGGRQAAGDLKLPADFCNITNLQISRRKP
jgi:hypothetical protein